MALSYKSTFLFVFTCQLVHAYTTQRIDKISHGTGFVENKGQVTDANGSQRPDILFVAENKGASVYIRKSGLSYVFYKEGNKNEIDSKGDISKMKSSKLDFLENNIEQELTVQRIDVEFVGANPEYKVSSFFPSDDYFNYYYPHCPQGINGVKAYNKILSENIYNKIDIAYYCSPEKILKYDFIVNPGGNVRDIQLKYDGADEVTVVDGKIKVTSSIGELIEHMPKVYQEINGKIIDVDAEFELQNGAVSIKTGSYNIEYALVIDPWVTYYGGVLTERGMEINTDKAGDVLFVGYTQSNNFPVSAGVYQTVYRGGAGYSDAFIIKFDKLGRRVWATYYGGTQSETTNAIDVDAANNIFVTGGTSSPDLPMMGPSYQSVKNTGADIFIAKFTSGGNLVWSTFYGGTGGDSGMGIAVDNNGDAVVGATTTSSGITTTPGCFQSVNAGGGEIFITKFTNAGARVWATYYGDTDNESCFDIDTDNNNDVVFSGHTKSAAYPVFSAFQSVKPSATQLNAVLTKLNGTNGFPIWSTYCGSSTGEYGGIGVAIDGANNVLMTGTAMAGFPTTAGSFQPATAGQSEPYLVKFSPTGVRLWATYIGGTYGEEAWDVVTDANNDIYISGDTYSDDFPSTSCAYSTAMDMGNCCGGGEDAYLAKFDASGQRLCSGYFGGLGHDENFMMAEFGGMVYLVSGAAFGAPITPGAFQSVKGGVSDDIVLTQLCGYTCGLINITSDFVANKTNACAGEPLNFTPTYTTCDTTKTKWLWTFTGANTTTSTLNNPTNIIYNSAGTYTVRMLLITPCDTDTVIKTSYINISDPSLSVTSIVNSDCSVNNGSASVAASGGQSGYNYFWPSIANSGSTATGLSVGTFSVIVTDGFGCTATTAVTITQPAMPVLTLTAIDASCAGSMDGSAIANASGSTSYLYNWSNGQTNSSVNNLSGGVVTCTLTGTGNCVVTSSVMVNEPAPISTTVTTSPVSCLGNGGNASVNVNGGTPGYNYLWSNGGNISSVSNLNTGIYTMTVTDANSCTYTTSISIINSTPITTTVSTTDVLCNGLTTGVATVVPQGGAGGYLYSWNNSVTTSSATNLGAGNYSCIITDQNGCTTIANATITQPLLPLTAGAAVTDALCNRSEDGVGTITVQGGTPVYFYNWNTSSTTSAISNLFAGNYSCVVTDNNGCSFSVNNIVISEPPLLTVNYSPSYMICNGQAASLTSNGNGGTPAYNYLWNTGQVGSSIIVQPAMQSLYTLTVSDVNSCSATITINVLVNQLPVVSFVADDTLGCAPLCINFSGQGGNNYQWDFGDGSTGASSSEFHCYTNPGLYSIALLVTDANGCSNSLVKPNYINIANSPIANFSANPTSTTLANSTIIFTDQSLYATVWNWTFGDVSNATSILQNTSYTYHDTGTYNVKLIVENELGCSDTAYDVIHIRADFEIFIPNTFTPNEDGLNDVFMPKGMGIDAAQFVFYVYDRWGNLIFESDDPTIGWDGRANGGNEIAQQDTYVWKIALKDELGLKHRFTGHINLIR